MTFHIIQIPNLISRCVLREIVITLCFVLADYLHIDILKFVAGHGTVVHPVSIIIVFGWKQAQHNSRTHQLVLSELSVGAHKMLNRIGRTCISLLKYRPTVEHFSFHAFYKCGLQRDLMSYSSRLTLQRR